LRGLNTTIATADSEVTIDLQPCLTVARTLFSFSTVIFSIFARRALAWIDNPACDAIVVENGHTSSKAFVSAIGGPSLTADKLEKEKKKKTRTFF
jgi:hypothetical protein